MSDQTTRDAIVEAADELFYRMGYDHTSFADIAGAVKISRGNFYFHFKSKDEILDAVIDRRVTNTQRMLDRWEADSEQPEDRIRSFIHILITNWAKIKLHGCPVGTLCAELAKQNHPAQAQASDLFALFRTWLRQQFTLLGREADADALSMHILAWSQGVATLANAFHDEKFVRQEVQQACDWLQSCKEDVPRALRQDRKAGQKTRRTIDRKPRNRRSKADLGNLAIEN